MPVCWIIAGPNGAGKTTFALNYLPAVAGCRRFINADLIAAGLSPLAPERELAAASRLFLGEIDAAIAAGEDFAFETTLAGRGYLRLIDRLRATGWRVELIYLALPSADLSRLRVAERVSGRSRHPDRRDRPALSAQPRESARCLRTSRRSGALFHEQRTLAGVGVPTGRHAPRHSSPQLVQPVTTGGTDMSPSQSSPQPPAPDPDMLAMLNSLQATVARALDRKRRLGQYWVEWSPEGPVFRGPGAPGIDGSRDPGD